ncbi:MULTISPECIES: hypothetical protein [unclassified Pantoea]|uniref:hypothetical protein n=1 Tax=unclassified Pantoea TaxID=2630326 RepID=UPI00301CE5ED
MKSLRPATQLLLCGGVLGLTFLASSPASASEKDELTSAQRMIVQVQASLERARVSTLPVNFYRLIKKPLKLIRSSPPISLLIKIFKIGKRVYC